MNETYMEAGFEQLIRDRAYAMWESEGCPAGRDVDHWRMSEDATLAELAVVAPVAPVKTAAKPKAKASKKAAASKRAAETFEALAAL